MKTLCVIGLSAVVVLLASSSAAAQGCVLCGSDIADFAGKQASNRCLQACDCCAASKRVFSRMHPGFFTAPEGGKLIVTSVINGSPAEAGGLRKGDEILLVNDEPVGTQPSCAEKDRKDLTLLVRRGNDTLRLAYMPVAIESILETAWNSSLLRQASATNKPPIPSGAVMLFEFGIRWNEDLQIIKVLRASPANLAGIQVGDRITSLGEVAVNKASHSALDKLMPSYYRSEVALEVSDGSNSRKIRLTAESLSNILRHLSEVPLAEAPQGSPISN